MRVSDILMEFIEITLGFKRMCSEKESKGDCWYICLNGSYIKVDDYQWELDDEGDVVLNINRY